MTLTRSRAVIVVGLLTTFSLLLRWFGLGFQLPQFVPADALVLAGEVEVLRHGGDASYRMHPNLYPQLIPALVLLLPAQDRNDPPPKTLEEHLASARAPYYRVCIIIALLSVIAVPGTYLLARRFLERSWSLVAAALIATSILHLWFSQEARPHSAAMSFTLLSVLASLRLRRKPVISSYILAGLAAGAAIAALQSGVAALIPLAAAFVFRSRGQRRSSPFLLLVPIAIVALSIMAFYPSMPGAPQVGGPIPHGIISFDGSTISLMGHSIVLSGFDGKGLSLVLDPLLLYDPWIALTAVLGISIGLVALLRRWRSANRAAAKTTEHGDLIVVLSYAVPYALVIALYHASAQRFVIPLLPFLACSSAFGLRAVWNFACTRGRWLRVGTVAAIVVMLSIQTAAAARLSQIRSRPDTTTEAAAWIRTHVPPGTGCVLVSPSFDLPLLETTGALERNKVNHLNPNQRWFAYQASTLTPTEEPGDRFNLVTLPTSKLEDRQALMQNPAEFVRSLHAEWVVLEIHRLYDWKGITQLRAALATIGERVALFSPDGADSIGAWGDTPITHQGFDPIPFPVFWFLRILEARCTGMVLEIWKVGK